MTSGIIIKLPQIILAEFWAAGTALIAILTQDPVAEAIGAKFLADIANGFLVQPHFAVRLANRLLL